MNLRLCKKMNKQRILSVLLVVAVVGNLIYWIPWPDVTHAAVRKVMYDDGTGVRETFWPNGQPRTSYHQQKGNTEGLFQQWYESGQKQFEATFVSGRLHGEFRSWHEDGSASLFGRWENGLRSDTWTFWDTNGIVLSQISYEHGKSWNGSIPFWVGHDKKRDFLTYSNGILQKTGTANH